MNERDIFRYNCEKKIDFIKKGLGRLPFVCQLSGNYFFTARARTKAKEGVTEGWFAKFPKDVIYCEQLTNGNPNILNEEPFVEKKKEKVDYSLIFGDPEEI